MKFAGRIRALGADKTLTRVVKNSGYLFGSNVISAVFSIVTANLLGVERFGALGIVIAFVSNVNRLLSFRMGDVIVRYVGEYLAVGEKEKAAAVVKAAGLLEAVTSILAFGIMVLLAPFGAKYILHDPSTSPLIMIYGISILGMLTTETATGVLQVGNHYRSQSLINLIQAIVTAIGIVIAAITNAGIEFVLLAYLAGKLVAGLGPIFTAWKRLTGMLGAGWWRASLDLLPPRKELLTFAFSTNLSGTINMVVRDSELLWVGGLVSTEAAGYYRTALSVINLLILPINPFIATTYPEITRSIAQKLWQPLKSLLRRVTIIAGGWTLAVGVVLLLFGRQLLFTPWIPWNGHLSAIYHPEYLPALPVILILLLGFGVANSLYWNRSLLLAFGKADYPLKVAFWATLVKITLTVLFVPRLGYLFEAALMSAYLVVTVILLLWKGLRLVKQAQQISN